VTQDHTYVLVAQMFQVAYIDNCDVNFVYTKCSQ